MTTMVVGGAGYIGAHVVSELAARGEPVLVVDTRGAVSAQKMPWATCVNVDITLDKAPSLLGGLMVERQVKTVVHLAALKSVSDSFSDPELYRRVNVDGTDAVLRAMMIADVRRLIFASSAAVYAPSSTGVASESAKTIPQSPYGATKLDAERLIARRSEESGIDAVVLRYFNVAGCAEPKLADLAASSVMARFCRASVAGEPLRIYGLQFGSVDGSAVRDYIDVRDLARLHADLAVDDSWRRGVETYNVGRGVGVSVLELARALRALVGRSLPIIEEPARIGDVGTMVADISKLRAGVDWGCRFGVVDMVQSTIRGYSTGCRRE